MERERFEVPFRIRGPGGVDDEVAIRRIAREPMELSIPGKEALSISDGKPCGSDR